MLELLRAVGLGADIAVNGQDAIEKARTGTYAMALMDVQMPGLGGLEAARADMHVRRSSDSRDRNQPVLDA